MLKHLVLSGLAVFAFAAFPVREEKEFNVSHIKGATYVDPSIKAEAFMTEFEQDWTGKTIVFYCSVGQRSSLLAARVQTALKAKGASEVVNLEKGIFGWHNQSMPLTNHLAPITAFVFNIDFSVFDFGF